MRNLQKIRNDIIEILPILKESYDEESEDSTILDVLNELDYDDVWSTFDYTEFREYDSPFQIQVNAPFNGLEDAVISYVHENVNDIAKDVSPTKWLHIEGMNDAEYRKMRQKMMFNDFDTYYPKCLNIILSCDTDDMTNLERGRKIHEEIEECFRGGRVEDSKINF